MKSSIALKTRVARLIVALFAIAAFACLGGLAFAGGDSSGGKHVFVPELGMTVSSDKAAALQHSLLDGAAKPTNAQAAPAENSGDISPPTDPIPARLIEPNVPVPISPAIMQTTNGWLVSDGSTLVAVYAGAAGDDRSQGRLAIVRQDFQKGIQTVDIVDAGATGALTIVNPPLGAAIETSAQRSKLTISGAHGARRTLRLTADKVEIPDN